MKTRCTLLLAVALAAFCWLWPGQLTAQTAPLTITSTSPLPTATVGVAYSFTFTATGGYYSPTGYTWSVISGSVPGLSLNPGTGVFSGIPTQVGTFAITVRVADMQGQTATKPFTIDVISPVRIVTTSPLPPGAVGVLYSQTLTAAGGTAPYFWGIGSGSLPPGLTLSESGAISGVPSMVGTFTVTIFVYDATERSDSRAFTIVIANPLAIVTASPLPSATVGVTYSQTLVASGGSGSYSWIVSGGSPPPGLFLGGNGVLSGTPTTEGSYAFIAQVRDSFGLTTTKVISVTVIPQLEITTPPTLPAGRVGAVYGQTFEATGGTPPYRWSAGEDPMPPGLSFDSTGIVRGTPTVAGTYSFTINVTDSRNASASKRFTVTIRGPALTITTGSPLPGGRVGQAYSVTIAATGGSQPYLWSATGVPAGLQFSAAGVLSGTPAATGSFTITVTVTDAVKETASARFALNISAAPLVITTASPLPRGRVGDAYSVTLAAEGGVQPYTWSAASTPVGLSFSSAGVLSGTPSAAGTFSISVTVTDSEKTTTTKAFSLTVDPPRLVITTASPLPGGRVGDRYAQQLAAEGGVPPYSWSATGLPAGLALSAAGLLSGTPTASGTYTLNVTVTDSTQVATSRAFALTITAPPLAITTTALAAGAVGSAYAGALAASGGEPPYSWSLADGTLPAGVSLSAAGELRGVPTTPGAFQFTARVSDSRGNQATRSFTLNVVMPALPAVSIQGLEANVNPVQQPQVVVALASAFPVAITGRLTLTFTSDAANPADDPSVQFSTGGRTVSFTIPAGQTRAVFPSTTLAIQTGTVAGRIVVTAQFTAAGVDITPTPAPSQTSIVRAAAPVISSVRATRTAGGIEVVVTGFSTPRQVTQAVFRFTASGVGTLQTTELTVPLDSVFTTWYRSSASAQFGSSFSYTQPFTVTGNVAAIGSVSVTLTNAQGSSQAMSAAIQ